MSPILLEIVAPDRQVLISRVEEVGAPGIEGDFGVLPGHTPFLTILRPGILWYRTAKERKNLVVRKGYVEVRPDHVSVLAEGCFLKEDLDPDRVAAEIKEAEAALDRDLEEGRDYAESMEHLAIAYFKKQVLETSS